MATNQIRVAGINPLAIKQAAMLGEEIFEQLETINTADLIKKTSAVVLLTFVKKYFPIGIRKAWPRVNSGRVEGEIDTSENNPDYTKAVSGKRTVWCSYFDTIIERAPYVLKIRADIEGIEAIKTGGIGAQLDRDADMKTLEQKIKGFAGAFRRAVRLDQAEQAITEYYPECKLAYRKDAEGDVKQVQEPIMLHPQELPLLGENFTVTQFIGLDFKAVHDSGETDPAKKWEILIATKARGTPDEGEEDADNIDINNMPRFETGAASMLDLLENGGFTTQLYNKFEKAKDINSVADFILTVDSLAIELNAVAAKLRAPKPGKGETSSLLHRSTEAVAARDTEAEAEADDTINGLSMDDADIPEMRKRFPAETKGLSDRQIYEVVANTDDDQEDNEWRKLFVDKAGRKAA